MNTNSCVFFKYPPYDKPGLPSPVPKIKVPWTRGCLAAHKRLRMERTFRPLDPSCWHLAGKACLSEGKLIYWILSTSIQTQLSSRAGLTQSRLQSWVSYCLYCRRVTKDFTRQHSENDSPSILANHTMQEQWGTQWKGSKFRSEGFILFTSRLVDLWNLLTQEDSKTKTVPRFKKRAGIILDN